MILHIDTSALGRLYLGDQSDSVQLSHTVRDGDRPVITSELTDVEMASTLARANRDGAIAAVTALDSDTIAVALAQRYVLRTPLRTLDAIHVAA